MLQKLSWICIFSFISLVAVSQPYQYHNEWIDYGKTYYKFSVMGFGSDVVGAPVRNGMVRIPYSTIVSAGLGNTAAENFQLFRDGEEVALYVSKPTGLLSDSDYIEFLGEINNGKLDNELYRNPDYQLSDKWSLQTDTAAYFLTVNTASPNKRFQAAANNTANTTLRPDDYFMYTVGRYFRNNIFDGFGANVDKKLYSSSYDKGEGWVSRAVHPPAGCGSATLPQSFLNLHPYLQGPAMTLRVNAVGDDQNSRRVRINLDQDSITTFQMDYSNYVKVEQPVDVSKISAGVCTFYIVNNSNVACDEMRVAMIELTYPRVFNMDGASYFNFTADASASGRYLAITNFNSGGVSPVLYDRANNKRYVCDISTVDTIKVVLDPSAIPYDLVLTTQAGNYYKPVTNLHTKNFTDYSNVANQGDYLIISNPLIYGSGQNNYVDQYRQYRSSQQGGSFKTTIIDINELVDQFSWGIKKHPLSVKNFLRYARNNFTNSPKYVFIIGKGMVYSDYRLNENDPLADGLNLVPTFGNPASDNLLASDDITANPAIPIGRLSAVTPQEVGDYLLKVKQHDSLQQKTTQSIDKKGWMKNVIHIAGANDDVIGKQIDGYLAGYKQTITDTSFGANVIDFSKSADPSAYPDAINSFKQTYEHGAALVTYFGHSSNSNLDFNLDNPGTYNNQYKYPVFIANGCSAGDNYLFEPDRFNTQSTVSEKFVLSPQRGAIGYLASTSFGVINYLDLYTKAFYKALGKTQYNQSVGTAIQAAIADVLNTTGINDYYSRVHSEQFAFNGDPAIALSYSPLPDYVIEASQMQATPSFVSVADTSFKVKVKISNVGRATKDSVSLLVQRQFSNGKNVNILTKTFANINFIDSVTVNVPITSNLDAGTNSITATIDYNNKITETSENNNSATLAVEVSENEIRPVFPYNYAVITSPDAKLFASTVNPLRDSCEYLLEIDTTALFNSPALIRKSQVSTGGVVAFDPGISYQQNVTYYWRVAPSSATNPHWVNASFVYRANAVEGFEQGHLYQNLQSQLTHLQLDSTSRKYKFENKLHNLFITNSVYPTSGTENEHFSISVDGSTFIESACVGSSVIFNVFDSVTFQPVKNLTQPFGAAAVCDAGREYNFEYQYLSPESRKNAMDFLDAVPKGAYVTARLILDDPYSTTAAEWAADTATYGSGNSLYHRLKQNGFSTIDSFYYARTWAFVFKKGDSTFTPTYSFSHGLYDRITMSVNCTTPNVQGVITSPVFGPAKAWKNVYWNGNSEENANDKTAVNVYGIKTDNSDTLLCTLDSSAHTFDISAVDAKQFPFVRLQMQNADFITATPYQLSRWGVGYKAVPEGAIAPNLYFNIPDTVGANGSVTNYTLHAGFAFKNVSKADFDSLSLKVILYDFAQNPVIYPLQKLRALVAGDSLHVDTDLDVNALNGWYNVYIEVNPWLNHQPEQFSFNNFLYKRVYINNNRVMPVTLLNFNATLLNKNVSTTWAVTNEINTKQYEVEHSVNGAAFAQIGVVPARSTTANINRDYSFLHLSPPAGKNYYRLKIVDSDGSYKYSAIRLVTVGEGVSVNVYPNPVTSVVNISISSADGRACTAQLLNTHGQQLWQQKVSGTIQVNMQKLPAGSYILQVEKDGSISTFKIEKL